MDDDDLSVRAMEINSQLSKHETSVTVAIGRAAVAVTGSKLKSNGFHANKNQLEIGVHAMCN